MVVSSSPAAPSFAIVMDTLFAGELKLLLKKIELFYFDSNVVDMSGYYTDVTVMAVYVLSGVNMPEQALDHLFSFMLEELPYSIP